MIDKVIKNMCSLNTSQDMFEENNQTFSPDKEVEWLGVHLEKLKSANIYTYPSVRPSNNHTILFKLPLKECIEPHPTRKTDVWDVNYVRMPHSPQSLYPISEAELKPRWEIVKSALTKQIGSSEELETAIFSYNSKNSQRWSLDSLHLFFSQTLEEEEAKYFFRSVLPGIINLALDIEDKFRGGLPLLRKGCNRSISMSQEQAGILLANAFLCTFPRRNSFNQNTAFPSINFNRLFQCGSLSSVQQKLKCFINYFRRISRKRPKGVITYTRRHVKPNDLPMWSESEAKLTRLHITSRGTIEDQGAGLMEVDFANKFVGGGVLGRGSVQEEIKFLICPELVVSRLFTESLDDTEALVVTGCERYNKYEGYGDSFTWSGNYVENELKRDTYHRLNSVAVAIDATHFNNDSSDQFKQESINRELNKAYSGFSLGQEGNIATGNWGCGAFNGDPRLKALLQIMAASVCRKSLAYFTFGDCELRDDIYKMYTFLIQKGVNVGMLWQLLAGYSSTKEKKDGLNMFKYLHDMLNTHADVSVTNCKNPLVTQNEHKTQSRGSLSEPVTAETYSIKTEEGRKRCIETEQERWEAYQNAMIKFSEMDARNSSATKAKHGTTKRKITDYFTKSD